MTATLEHQPQRAPEPSAGRFGPSDFPPEPRPEPSIGPRERRRLEQARRSHRRYRQAAVAAAVVLAATAVLGVVGARLLDGPSRAASGPTETGTVAAEVGEAPASGPEAAASDATVAASGPEAAASGSEAPADERARVQLLNGVGAPGVADGVEGRLPEDEFRVVVADNAPEFGVKKTRLLVYDDGPASLAVAERLREVLGAGTISVSRQPQSVVDVTVIIGRDIDGS